MSLTKFKLYGFKSEALILCGLLALIFVAYFRRFLEFGFYGDDHAFFGRIINSDWGGVIDYFTYCLTYWPQGRPLGMGINLNLLPATVFKLAGLSGLHVISFVIVAINATLIFRLVKQSYAVLTAFCAAAFYALAPADTVQNSLLYAYNFEIGVLFGILSAQAAHNRQRIWFAVNLLISLLMIEPAAMFALIFPLFVAVDRKKEWLKFAVVHVSIWASVVAFVLLLRIVIGDPWGPERVSEIVASPLVTAHRGLTAAMTGLFTHAALVVERLVQPLREIDQGIVLVLLAASVVAGFVIWVANRHSLLLASGEAGLIPARAEKERQGWGPLVRLGLAGISIMLAVYFTYFRDPWYPANWRTGFMSGVHLIAALGSCLVFASLVSAFIRVLPPHFRKFGAVVPVAAIALLAGFGEIVQRDYAESWAFQRKFWQAYASIAADATDGTYVLVLDRNLPLVRFTDIYSWGYEILPAALFSYEGAHIDPMSSSDGSSASSNTQLRNQDHSTLAGPSDRKTITRPPSVIFTAADLATAIKYNGQRYSWKPTYYFMLPKTDEEQPEAGNVIVLVYDAVAGWRRLEGNSEVDGGVLLLKPSDSQNVLHTLSKLPLTKIYGL